MSLVGNPLGALEVIASRLLDLKCHLIEAMPVVVVEDDDPGAPEPRFAIDDWQFFDRHCQATVSNSIKAGWPALTACAAASYNASGAETRVADMPYAFASATKSGFARSTA